MTAPVIKANYDVLSTIAGVFSQHAEAVQQLTQQVMQLEKSLEGGGWAGSGAQAFFGEMSDLVFPAMRRLNGALNDAQALVGRISDLFHDAEEEAGRLFQGNGVIPDQEGSSESGFGFRRSSGDDSSKIGPRGEGHSTDITKYKNGVDGWSLVSVDGSQRFTPDELIRQRGSTCTWYAPINLLIANGYHISQSEADGYVESSIDDQSWWSKHFGSNIADSKSIVRHWTSDYESGDFDDRAEAEQFMIKTVKGGKPVMVNMEDDDSFGLSGGHTVTVLGVKIGSDGRLQSVLVATNWSPSLSIFEIPGQSFMDDWMDFEDGAYITVGRAPVAPKQP